MKKIFLFCAAMMAAMSMNAAITNMTCAQAKQEVSDKLQAGETGTDSVAVTGYVTDTNGQISRGQQTFWLDDVKGTTKTFQAYWCNMPEGENPLNVGDKVTIKGFLMNFNGTAEMKNGDVVILERVVVNIDTIDADVCEAIAEGEALNEGTYTPDVFAVVGVVSQVDAKYEQYNQTTFWMTCDDNQKKFEAYYVTLQENDGYFPNLGDTVGVLGKITNFKGTIEISNGKAWILGKSNFVPDTIRVNVADAIIDGKKLEKNETSADIYIVTGVCDSIAYAYSEEKHSMSFYMCDDINTPTYDFEAYNCKAMHEVKIGDQVSIVGQLKRYYKAADGDKPEIDLVELVNCYIEGEATGVEDIKTETVKAKKFIEDGQLVIVKDGVRYNVLGAQLR